MELRVVENSGAAANDRRTTLADVPRKAGRGREVFVLLLRRAQVAAVDRREIRRLRQVVVEHVGFVLPSEPVVQREVRRDLPPILDVEMESVIAARLVEVVGGMRRIADSEEERDDRQLLEIVVALDLAVGQAEQRRQRRTDVREEFRRQQIDARRIEEAPVPDRVNVLVGPAELHLMGALLPRGVVGDREPVDVPALRRVEVVAEGEVHRVQVGNLGAAEPDAVAGDRIPGTCRRRVPVPPVHVREAQIVDQGAAQDAGDAEDLLVHVILVRDEVRRRHRDAEGAAVRVAVVRVPHEH